MDPATQAANEMAASDGHGDADLGGDFLAAYQFVESMVPRADGKLGGVFPFWHGWALRAAFEAGAKWQDALPKDVVHSDVSIADSDETPMTTAFMCSVKCCARCGKDHESLPFLDFQNCPTGVTHWAECPETHEPILMRVG